MVESEVRTPSRSTSNRREAASSKKNVFCPGDITSASSRIGSSYKS